MRLDERLNDRWFRLDEPLVSAFVERWRLETHTFHMPFGECTITLQDIAYQLGLPVDGHYFSGCLTDFHLYIEGGRPAWTWFHELLGVLPPENQIQKFAVNCTWFQETFGECPDGADDETLFADKSGNPIHIRWLPFIARLEEMGGYSWGSAALAWLYRCICRVANKHVVKLAGPLQLLQSWIFWRFPSFRPPGYDAFSWPLASRWSGYNPGISNKGPRVQMARLKIDLLQPRDVREEVTVGSRRTYLTGIFTGSIVRSTFYSSTLWPTLVPRMISWHGGISMGRDSCRKRCTWGIHEVFLFRRRRLRGGAGRVLEMDRVHDVPDRRRVERRARVGTRRSQREHAWLDHAMEEVEDAGRGRGRRRGRGGRRRGADARDDAHQAGRVAAGGGMGDPSTHTDAGLGDYFVGVPGDDQTLQNSTPWVSSDSMFPDFLGSDGIVAEFGGPHFLEDIQTIMQEDDAARGRAQPTATQAPLDVDLNELATVPPVQTFALGGTPASAHTLGSHSVAGPSSSRPVHVSPRTPTEDAEDDDHDSIEDEEPMIRRGHRTRVPRHCFTGSHLLR
ncbi:hypothetical protein Ahy_B03g067074 [Arachis hypogaea]|uniref:Aminotransferase-like plant mobile domain-containing protein n=1 Tax=Arachis hypogaea TaxID=3818 RepID=A0A445A5X5_ARAHY|nr:hypothetical protein Ahy_B03g067074 [Arachis hypogaea]